MGRAKQKMMEDDERGWRELDGYVCLKCVDDDFLKGIIKNNLCSKRCTFCDRRSKNFIACPANDLMPAIAGAVFYSYNDPVEAGVPYDGGLVDEGEFTTDMLMGLPLECGDEFFEAVANSFINQMWVDAPGGAWASSHNDDILNYSWSSFVRTIKHRTRFNFNQPSASAYAGSWEIEPQDMLQSIGDIIREQGLIKTIPGKTVLYRTRIADGKWDANADTMGAPPPHITRAGRMNPAGISYLYCAFQEETALAETIPLPPVTMNVAIFEVAKDLTVLNLADIPDIPSMFDGEGRRAREAISFLMRFVDDISQPVRKDGGEHIDYVPSQVVSEWFAQVFKLDESGKSIDGLIYPSAVAPAGVNLVVFPDHDNLRNPFNKVEFKYSLEKALSNWRDVVSALKKIGQ